MAKANNKKINITVPIFDVDRGEWNSDWIKIVINARAGDRRAIAILKKLKRGS